MEVQVKRGLADNAVGLETMANRESLKAQAGTQALPADTNGNEKDHRDHSGQGPGTGGNASAGAIPASSASKFDKKAWQRKYMRGYMQRRRAKLKEGQANE